MALQVWLPLSGSTANYGLSEYVINESGTRYVAGNLGSKALHCGEGSVEIQLNPTFTNLSIAFWFKAAAATANSVLATIGDTAIVFDGASKYTASGDGLVADGTELATVTNADKWTHFALVADGTNVKVYLNGELATTVAQAKTVASAFTTNKNIYLGTDSSKSSNWAGAIDDFKVFDNALSLRFIKELAKGLVVQYIFNHGGYGNENILKGSDVDEVELSTSAAYYAIENDKFYVDFAQDNTYTLSAVTSGSWASENTTTGQDASKKLTGIELYQKSGTEIASRTFYDLSKTGYVVINTTNAGRYYVGFLAYSDGTTTIDATISQVKVEVGDTATPYVPPKGTDAYKVTELSSVLTDTSGNMLNGTIGSKEPLWTTDVPVYDGGYDFNNNGFAESAELDLSEILDDYTLSVWFTGSEGRLFITDTYELAIPSVALDNKWHLITVTPESVYVDAQKVSANADKLGGTKFYFGVNNDGQTDTLTGCLVDFRLYATVLSDEEIQNLYSRRYGIDNIGQLYLGGFKEDSSNKLSLSKTGVLEGSTLNNVVSSDNTTYTDIDKFNISNKSVVNAVDVIEI